MKFFSLLIVAVAAMGVSCERHEFEGPDGTKQLHKNHASPAAHGKDAADAAHGEKPAAHAEEPAAHGEKPAAAH